MSPHFSVPRSDSKGAVQRRLSPSNVTGRRPENRVLSGVREHLRDETRTTNSAGDPVPFLQNAKRDRVGGINLAKSRRRN
jgi:hypothetical protein